MFTLKLADCFVCILVDFSCDLIALRVEINLPLFLHFCNYRFQLNRDQAEIVEFAEQGHNLLITG